MATIEARLDHLQLYAICEEDTGLTWAGGSLVSATKQLAAERATIIAGWNAAEKVMKAFVELEYLPSTPSGWYCSYCCDGQVYPNGYHIPSTCHVAAAQAALAKMEETDGND